MLEPRTNSEWGRELGITHAQVSRLRHGRAPSRCTMERIAEIANWTVLDQELSLLDGNWAAAFDQLFPQQRIV